MCFITDQNRRASNFREFTCLAGSESLLAKKSIFTVRVRDELQVSLSLTAIEYICPEKQLAR